MLSGFQQHLLDKGFIRTCEDTYSNEKINHSGLLLSTYSPMVYNFKKENKSCYWGLCEFEKPPVMFLGNDKIHIIQNNGNYRTNEDGYRILFHKWKDDRFDEIYEVFISDNRYFSINCEDENNISIEVDFTS